MSEPTSERVLTRLADWWRRTHPPLDYEARCHGAPDPRSGCVSCPCGADTGDECLHHALTAPARTPSEQPRGSS